MVNPYLMAAALIKAMDDGIKRNLDPGPPEERNIYQAMEAGKQVQKLPMTLGDALAALEKDEVIRSALPDEMYRLYDDYKRDEWERFLHTVDGVGPQDVSRLPAVTAGAKLGGEQEQCAELLDSFTATARPASARR